MMYLTTSASRSQGASRSPFACTVPTCTFMVDGFQGRGPGMLAFMDTGMLASARLSPCRAASWFPSRSTSSAFAT